jgi:hypothetical protein
MNLFDAEAGVLLPYRKNIDIHILNFGYGLKSVSWAWLCLEEGVVLE